MPEEIEPLIEAIRSLRQEANIFKDYLFPIVLGISSSLLGGFAAYLTFNYKDKIQLEKEKIYAVNNCFLLAEAGLSSLTTIKSNYQGKLTDDPFQRALTIPALLVHSRKLDLDISNLAFIAPTTEGMNSCFIKWRQLPLIRNILDNFNLVIEVWDKRNEFDRRIKEAFLQDNKRFSYSTITAQQILDSKYSSDFIVLIDLTEYSIHLTDQLIIEFYEFLTEFPKIVKPLIKSEYINRYGPLLHYSASRKPELLEIIKKTPEVNYAILAHLFGETEETVKYRYAIY